MPPEHGSRESLQELMYLYEKLTIEERDELLQCLLIAAPRGGEAMIGSVPRCGVRAIVFS